MISYQGQANFNMTRLWQINLSIVGNRTMHPNFTQPLNKSIAVNESQTYSYHLPPVMMQPGQETVMFVSLGAASAFASYENGALVFAPGHKDIGTYEITVTLSLA